MKIELRPNQKLSVLVVDDEADIRETLRMFLEMMEVFTFVVEAVDGSDGFKKAQNQQFDFIITDLMMPKVKGIEFIENYNAYENSMKKERKTPFVILSANVTGDEVKRAIEMGVRYVITKPCTADQFIQKVQEVLIKHCREKIKVLKGDS